MNFLHNKKVAVFGLGTSGLAALKLLREFPCELLLVGSGAPENWRFPTPFDQWELLRQYSCFADDDPQIQQQFAAMDLIIISPGIPLTHRALSLAQQVPIWSEIELAYQFCTHPIVAITGSNGKTTTATMMAEMLRLAGHRVFLGGNIGTAFADYALENYLAQKQNQQQQQRPGSQQAPYDWVVLELSSFQLETVHTFHPQVAMILNLTRAHEERYASEEDYGLAKMRIALNLGPGNLLVYSADHPLLQQWAIKAQAQQKMHLTSLVGAEVEQLLQEHLDLEPWRLPGQHNLENLFFCLQVFLHNHWDLAPCQLLVQQFQGLPHRIEPVLTRTLSLLKIYNDSKSTNLQSTTKAVLALSDGKLHKLHLVMGGKKRNEVEVLPEDFMAFLNAHVDSVFVVGESGEDIYPQLSAYPSRTFQVEKWATLQQLYQRVVDLELQGQLLFSPGYPSFDQFKNYGERGDTFKKLFSS